MLSMWKYCSGIFRKTEHHMGTSNNDSFRFFFPGSSFKSSCSKGEKTLEFVPINLHLQRMYVHSPRLKGKLYSVHSFLPSNLVQVLSWKLFFFQTPISCRLLNFSSSSFEMLRAF